MKPRFFVPAPPPAPLALRRHWRPRSVFDLVVRALKLLLPAVAVGLVVLIALWTDSNLTEGRFRIGATELAPRDMDRFNLLNARFEGVDFKNRPFTITAERATEIDDASNLIALGKIKADITLGSGSWVALNADGGLFRQKIDLLDLKGGISLFHDRGYAIEAASLRVDLKERVAVSYDPVTLQGPEGYLTAEGFRLTEEGDRVQFFGHSKLVLHAGAEIGGAVGQ